MPTGGERLTWGYGDGSTLTTFETPFGRVGGLICWENYMPLARVAMYEQHIDILVAPTWDNSDVWPASMRHIAKEGRCYVLGITPCLRASDVPGDVPGRDAIYGGDDDWMSRGNTIIVDPYGEVLAGPVSEREEILYADIDIDKVRRSRRQFDVVGHYARPDVFRFEVNPPGTRQ
jgi:nitrilase